MILNNYLAMKLIKPRVKEPLTPEFVFELHRQLAEDTLDDPACAGRLRGPDEEVVVGDAEGTVFHRPPASGELRGRLEAMCRFANDETPGEFIHPLVRAMLLHFWLAYDHPFVDGNGRTARALFYWAGLHHGYWLLEFISISRIVLRSRGDYYRAFLYSETDHNDATYFLLNQARVIDEAVTDLRAWVARKAKETKRFEERIRGLQAFNHRQQALLIHALKHPKAEFEIRRHQHDHQVVYQTARTDLLALEKRRLLTRSTRGKTVIFKPVLDLESRLDQP
jgi:Fic family protein